LFEYLQQPSSAAERSATPLAPDPDRIVYTIAPRDTDPAIAHFLKDHYVMFGRGVRADAPLFLFLPGTGGHPGSDQRLLATAAVAGYRAVALMYDDMPADGDVCYKQPDPSCSASFRERRIFGDGNAPGVTDSPAETIEHRLTALLSYLAAYHPGEGWNVYLRGGTPVWERIVVSGHSQGAGMAAFIAKRHTVARVALFSSPWDFVMKRQYLAPWVSEPSATPVDRWYGMYHARERDAETLARAFAALGIVASHVHVVTLEPRARPGLREDADLYHVSVVGDGTTPLDNAGLPAYRDDWSFVIGSAR
jgi:hypothetical protein